jgi:hypothetical protein
LQGASKGEVLSVVQVRIGGLNYLTARDARPHTLPQEDPQAWRDFCVLLDDYHKGRATTQQVLDRVYALEGAPRKIK